MKMEMMVLFPIGKNVTHARQLLFVIMEQIKYAGVSKIVPRQHMVGVQNSQVICQ